jgi:hypothetical protein
MELVWQRDDDEVDRGVRAHGLDGAERATAEAPGEGLAALRARPVVGDHAGVGDVAQPERMELADEAGAEHPDADVSHQ